MQIHKKKLLQWRILENGAAINTKDGSIKYVWITT